MLTDKDLSLIAWLLEEDRAPAIVLYPPFPPHAAPKVRSKIGGLPNLPADHPWPMGKFRGNTVPLHFLAQIDCAELPRFDHRLPTRGVLYFFGCDMDQDWCSANPHDDAHVLYVEKLPPDTPDREPPPDLPPINERYAAGHEIAAHGALPGEDGPNIHIEWPLIARKIDTWPNAGAFQDIGGHMARAFAHLDVSDPLRVLSMSAGELEKYRAASNLNESIAKVYDERVRFKRLDAFAAAIGTTAKSRAHHLPWEHSSGRCYDEPWPADGVRFPQLGVMIDRVARHVVKDALFLKALSKDLEDDAERHIQAIVDAALRWVERARDIRYFDRPADTDVQGLNSWLAAIHAPFPSKQSKWVLKVDTNKHVRGALIDTINALASSAPEKFPARYYDALAADFTPFGFLGTLQIRQHQMLGHVPSSQDVKAIDNPHICLLQLWSDSVRHMGFGDAGECTFWIKPDDLAAARFEKAWATIEGG